MNFFQKRVFSLTYLLQKRLYILQDDCYTTFWSPMNCYLRSAILGIARRNCFSARKILFFNFVSFDFLVLKKRSSNFHNNGQYA